MRDTGVAHLDYPCWCLLLAPQYPLRPDDARLRVDGAVNDVDAHDMAAVRIWVLVPHADNDVVPWVSGRADVSNQCRRDRRTGNLRLLVVEELGEVVHGGIVGLVCSCR